jgi:uncharacterized protein
MSKTDISNNYVKPYDIGNTIISASVSENEKIVTLNTEHKKHGYIKLAPIMSFSNTNWYNPEAVRRYRNSFLLKETAEEGYGIEFEFEKNSCKKIHTPIQFHDSSNVLSSKKTYNNIEFKKYFFIPPNKNSIIQIYEIKNLSNNQINSNFKISGKYGIMRASYGQITENGPIEIPTINNIYDKISENSFSITETGTGSKAVTSVLGDYNNLTFEEKSFHSSKPLAPSCYGSISLKCNKQITLALIISISDDENFIQPNISLSDVYNYMTDTGLYWNELAVKTGNSKWDYIVNRNFAYSYGCCCIKKYGAMITDHQSLPLTWNRDNYFMFKLIESIYKKTQQKEIIEFIKSHIDWLFTHITESGWGRSHLITGRIKDKVFQFDQPLGDN